MPQFIAPFPRKGVVLKAPEDRSVSSLLKFPVFLRALPSSIPVGQTKRRPFYGQAKGQLRLTWKPSAGSPQSEGSRFKTIVNQLSLNTGRQEGAAAGGSPLVPDGTTFPYRWEKIEHSNAKSLISTDFRLI